ncbi:hypothetical protein evm_010257 [Chilo suppressalis]|nr:hypothetical protein evm_010257 [Chilo suppressalis]
MQACINDVIRRVLVAVNVPAVLEPSGIFKDDGKRLDGMTLIPWRQGLWYGTTGSKHLPSCRRGCAAASSECSKRRKYSALNENYIFVPLGVETMGPCGPSARSFFTGLAKRPTEKGGSACVRRFPRGRRGRSPQPQPSSAEGMP